MAGTVNKCLVVGRLGGDPELRNANGKAVCQFSVATDDGTKEKPRTEWHTVVCWDKLAELCAKHLSKGRQVYVEGRMQTRSWDDKKSGEKKFKTEIVANNVVFLGDGPKRDAAPAEQGAPAGDDEGW